MKNNSRLLLVTLLVGVLFLMVSLAGTATSDASARGAKNKGKSNKVSSPQVNTNAVDSDDDDADLPPRLKGLIDKETYFQMRDNYINLLRGIDPDNPIDPLARGRAVAQAQSQSRAALPVAAPWTPIGPFSISNGQMQGGVQASATGRVTSIVVDPTNANKVYLGTAQGGVWRSLDGGTTWASIFDNAQTQSIGALALAPSNPSILYIGTGEPNLSADSYFGIGVYRIDNADTTIGALADLKGPINPPITLTLNAANGGGPITYNCFTGRSISQIIVHPTDPATIFVSTTTGAAGSGANSLSQFIPPIAILGVYRSTNATSAPGSVTFQKLQVPSAGGSFDNPPTGNRRIPDMALEPGNPDNLLVSVFGNPVPNDGGIFRSTNANAATPTFTQTLTIIATRINFAIQKTGSVVTVLAATSESPSTCAAGTGQLRKSIDGGVTWPAVTATAVTGGILRGANGYCGGQCFYNVVVAMDPNNANTIYIGGNARGACSDALKKSSDGVTFLRDDTSIHADTHALFVTATNPPLAFVGNDGGVWRRNAAQAAASPWTDLNSSPLNTMQFEGLSVHPIDRNFTIGGTQDNGTEAQQTSPGNWLSAEGGDGGYTIIDQSATDTDLNLKAMYHTFFNQSGTLIGFDRTFFGHCLPFGNPANKDSWEFRGFGAGVDATPSCDGTPFAAGNGLVGSDPVLFYAPMAAGPGSAGNPNTLYFGTNRLYRSVDRGDTMVVVSQAAFSGTSPVSSIGISRQNDNSRIVGTQNGNVFATTTGANPLPNTSFPVPANATGSTTNRFIGRAVIDPNDPNTGYVTLSYFTATATAAHVWKATNLNTTAVWTALPGTGSNVIPNVPVNAFAVDPVNSNNLFAGTDIGVFASTDGGTNWAPLGTGLPVVAVFDVAIAQPGTNTEVLRIATHGRGMWELSLACGITCPANITQSNDPNQCGAVVTYPAPTTTGSCTGTIVCSPASGSFFPVGTTTVTCTVGASPSCMFTVTVNDTQNPTITCPSAVTATAAASCPIGTSATTSFTVTASDNCPGVTVVCKDQNGNVVVSGQPFPVGTTTVTCTATDASGNTASCMFTVTAFSFCLQDDSNPGNVVLVNAQTGDFSFCCDGVPIASGRGTLTTRACSGSIDATKGDRQVHIQWDTAANNNKGAGTAYVLKLSNKMICQITDKNMSNNTCQCSAPPPSAAPKKPGKQRTY
jgi:hypothetical protein